jgi:hypothetical protein
MPHPFHSFIVERVGCHNAQPTNPHSVQILAFPDLYPSRTVAKDLAEPGMWTPQLRRRYAGLRFFLNIHA